MRRVERVCDVERVVNVDVSVGVSQQVIEDVLLQRI